MLEGLDTIAWRNLNHAYGAATDVPDLIRALLVDDDEIRSETLHHLFNNIWHQGTVYEASAYTVPFLIELLQAETIPDKASVLQLLACLAEGHSYLEAHAREWDDSAQRWRTILMARGKDLETEKARELAWVKATYEAVSQGIHDYLQLLAHEEQDVRMFAAYLLSLFPQGAAETVPQLQSRLPVEPDPQAKAGIVLALSTLMDSGPGSRQFFERFLQPQASESLAFVAALALARSARDQASESAVEVLLKAASVVGAMYQNARAQWAADARFYPGFPWPEGTLSATISTLRGLGLARGVPALIRMLSTTQDPHSAHSVAEALLDLVFQGQRQPNLGAVYSRSQDGRWQIAYWGRQPGLDSGIPVLTSEQRQALTALAGHDPFWEIDSELLEMYRLPTSRNVLREFVGVLAAET